MVNDRIRVQKIIGIPDYCPLPDYPNSSSMKLLVWNCRGAGNKVFKRNLRKFISIHKLTILVLIETKVQLSSMGLFFNKLGFTASTHMDPVGKCSGIWMLWDTFKSTVMALDANSQVIHAKIKRDNFSDWILSAVYASPIPRSRDALWENLESVADNMTEPCLVTGDFNDFASQNEKRSFSSAQDHTRTRKFQARLNRCKLMDLGCSGPRLTWTNGRQGLANTLDRAVCNTEWRLQFQKGEVRNLPRTYFDHSPLIVYTEGNLKMNTDGNARGDPGDGGFGGLIRDEKGIWICGFYGKLTKCSCIEAEIWAIYRGLTIAFEKGYKDLIIETDSMDAIDMQKKKVEVISSLRSLVEDSKFLIRRCGYTLQHVLREGNLSADGLAKMGADQDEPLVVMEDAPDGIRSQVVADLIGHSSRRQSPSLP
ncbi:uncharacterized protein LOC114300280 [Camellia sinensis]|uniref:uncharacterized protein LOC114300280 n=1 Tax=Camellia sinensis TaxID=4442 RepID=UPI001035C214|nr:uncharacterized protein LOC114300280 [Camellia sinensis]